MAILLCLCCFSLLELLGYPYPIYIVAHNLIVLNFIQELSARSSTLAPITDSSKLLTSAIT